MRHPQRNDRRGVAAVELAVLSPFLMFLFVLAVDYGRIFYSSVTITNCARAGAIYASDPFEQTESPYTSIQQAALAEAPNFTPQPTVSSATGSDAVGDPYVDVTVIGQFQTMTRYPGVPQSTTLRRTIRMRVAPAAPN